MTYNADGQLATTQVNGSTYTGKYAADGSWNIVINSSSSYVGFYHPCGAINAVIVTDPSSGFYNANGSMNVIANNFGGYSPVVPLGRAGGSGGFAYYVAASGSDSNPGTQSQPWQTLAKVAAQSFLPNTTVYFRGGDTFSGTLTLPASSGTAGKPIKYTSYSTGQATIAPAASTDGITGTDISYVTIDSLTVTGSGGTTGHGIHLQAVNAACSTLIVNNCNVSAMAGIGIWIDAGSNAGASIDNPQVTNNTANGNTTGFNGSSSGIRVSGGRGQQNTSANYNCTNVTITGNTANNNAGIAGTPSWCGAGIFMKKVKTGINQGNITDNNGANCNNASGPTGNWGAECSGVTWFGNISRNTKTAGSDGGGFDIDGGCDNCVIDTCLSTGNAGYGYLMFEYDDATFTSNNNNVLRNCISWNDLSGALRISSGGTHDNSGQCYNNYFKTVNTATNTIRLDKNGGAMNWQISNNNIESAKSGTTNMIQTSTGNPSGVSFTGNNYYTPNTLNIVWNGTTYTTIALWRAGTGQETIAAADTSKSAAPLNMGTAPATTLTLAVVPITTLCEPFRPDEASPLMNAGVDLFANYGINPGTVDFYGSARSTSGPWSIGHACMKSALKSVILNTTGSGNWTVPASFAQLFRIDCIGAGGGNNANNAGAGGGAYAASNLSSLTSSWVAGTTTVPYFVGAGVAGATGQDTTFGATSLASAVSLGSGSAVGAQGGKTNTAGTGGAGGLASASVGTTTYNGGSGGNTGAAFAGGGGGAAGPFGPGANGGAGGASGTGAGGGGGANGGTAGLTGSATLGGTGGTGPYNAGGAGTGTNGANGTNGAGGAGGGNSGGTGGAGGAGIDWRDSTSGLFYGAGGGSGSNAANSTATNTGGAFGGGAGGRSTNPLGGQGGIRVLYKTSASI